MADDFIVPETRVLAVSSHVVFGNVGNKIAVFVLQSLGLEVSALNTVQFSNHTGYRQWKGAKFSASEITDLFDGLKQSGLDDFDMMLSGYIPGAEAVNAVGRIAKELQAKAKACPGSFFWVLDPVMGDNGKLYVAEDVVPAYKSLISYADLILPNQFEAELLSEVKIVDLESLKEAVEALHAKYRIPHIIITSVNLDGLGHAPSHLSVVGSTRTAGFRARPFKITFPAIDCYFSGTGDMFAALTVARMREAVQQQQHPRGGVVGGGGGGGEGLGRVASWVSDDSVDAIDLPLAKAAEKVLASMHEVLSRTRVGMREAVAGVEGKTDVATDQGKKQLHLAKSKAAELKLVRNLSCLRSPGVEFRATRI